MKLKFEWERGKKQGVSFAVAKEVFRDPLAILRGDEHADHGEERSVIIGREQSVAFLSRAQNEKTPFA